MPKKARVLPTGFSQTNVVFSQIYRPLRVLASTWAVVLLTASSLIAEIIPANRIAPWQGNVGVPGGIPSRTTIYVNIVTDLGADPTGVVDCSGIIQNAINSCPAGQVVYIPPGRFRVGTQITLSNSKNNFTIRGAGMGLTTVFSASNNN